MTREYNHDDVCRGSVDGCDHEDGWCGGCERNVPAIELEGDPPRCDECRGEFEDEAMTFEDMQRGGRTVVERLGVGHMSEIGRKHRRGRFTERNKAGGRVPGVGLHHQTRERRKGPLGRPSAHEGQARKGAGVPGPLNPRSRNCTDF